MHIDYHAPMQHACPAMRRHSEYSKLRGKHSLTKGSHDRLPVKQSTHLLLAAAKFSADNAIYQSVIGICRGRQMKGHCASHPPRPTFPGVQAASRMAHACARFTDGVNGNMLGLPQSCNILGLILFQQEVTLHQWVL